jgi:hypothetical protein
LIRSFIEAFNERDLETVDSLFAPRKTFGWYRVYPLEREWPDSDDRSSLMPYFESRFEMEDKFALEGLSVNKEPNDNGAWGFGYTIQRESADPMPLAKGSFHGKGGADCRYIYAWHMSRL